MTAFQVSSPTNGESAPPNAEPMRSTTAPPNHAAVLLVSAESTEPASSALPVLPQPTMEDQAATSAPTTKFLLVESASARVDSPLTLPMSAPLALLFPTDSSSMEYALFAPDP